MTDLEQFNPQAGFEAAVAHHHAGRLHDAELGYRKVLQHNPKHADALHLLGIIAYQAGQAQPATGLIEQAIAVRPEPVFLANLGEVYRAAGQGQRGIACCQRAIAAAPKLALAYINLAPLLDETGRAAEAMEAAQKGVELDANSGAARRVLAVQLLKAVRTAEALEQSTQSVRLAPGDAQAWLVLSECQELTSALPAALDSANRAAQLAPKSAPAYNAIGRILTRMRRIPESVTQLQKALQCDPNFTPARENLALSLEKMNQFDQAIAICQDLIQRPPTSVAVIGVLAWAFINSGRPELAEPILRQSLLQTSSADLHQTLSVCMTRLGRHDEALDAIDRAIALDPKAPQPNFNKSLVLLFAGRLTEAWPLFEWRWQHPLMDAWRPAVDRPRWDGGPLDGKRILLFAEQGLGDTICFARYAKHVAQRGGHVILQVQPGLERLMQSAPGVSEVYSREQAPPAYDVQFPLLSLPGVFGATLDNIPADVPYIAVDPEHLQRWRGIIGDADGKLKVGLCWEGSWFQRENNLRSIQLQQLGPLAQVPNVRFYGLQKGGGARQALTPPAGMDLVNLDPLLADFSDTAAAISCMDLLITIDTSVLHVAGALALPTWCLLGRCLGHMWFGDGETTPWYPTVRLFRQPQPADWESVIERVKMELRIFAKTTPTATSVPAREPSA